ncbi:hypothetical protein ABTX62_24295 [Streptomyces sp. NPDC096046]|uniref:hypothetical protein n=1 Tax=Streptomyces sp. NPDC096046 TaxID=3155542 RepID=UPI00332204C2
MQRDSIRCITTAANVNDVTQTQTQPQTLVDVIPTVAGKPGRPRRRPAAVLGDKGYDSHDDCGDDGQPLQTGATEDARGDEYLYVELGALWREACLSDDLVAGVGPGRHGREARHGGGQHECIGVLRWWRQGRRDPDSPP